ncbi:MAG: YbeD family protein, partial [Wenzhouxiangellaceae bacterium]
ALMRPQLDKQGKLRFPCAWPVKAMTRTHADALDRVLDEIARHAAPPARDSVRIKPSRNGRYQSLTVTVEIDSRAQLEAIYSALRELDIVVMTL